MIIDHKEITVKGGLLKIAKLRSEYHEWLDNPQEFIAAVQEAGSGADVFTFIQKVTERAPKFDFYQEWDSVAALPLTTYEAWMKRQINDKTRNMIRRAQKSGVEVRLVDFNDDLIKSIKAIYDESPLRQGKPFKHYGKSLEELRESHVTYLERSDFIGAFYQDEMIGIVKLVHEDRFSDVMQIVSMMCHKDKAPTNALLAKAVEVCAGRGDSFLLYGPWDGQSLIDFKKHNAFEKVELPRYYVPLNLKGKVMLSLKLHRRASSFLPEKLIWFLAGIRKRYNAVRYNG